MSHNKIIENTGGFFFAIFDPVCQRNQECHAETSQDPPQALIFVFGGVMEKEAKWIGSEGSSFGLFTFEDPIKNVALLAFVY